MYIEDDRYRNIPMLVFRLQESCPEINIFFLIVVFIAIYISIFPLYTIYYTPLTCCIIKAVRHCQGMDRNDSHLYRVPGAAEPPGIRADL